jgi:hypothetical protein
MVFNLTHSQLILRYKENGGRIEPYTIVIMRLAMAFFGFFLLAVYVLLVHNCDECRIAAK